MLTLIAKDFKLLFAAQGSIKKRMLSLFATLGMLAVVITVEVYVFNFALEQLSNYHNARTSFLTLFLFIISCVMILLNTHRANQLFFDPKDVEQLSRRPVSNAQIVFSKLIFLFLSHYVITFLLVYPLLIAYGVLVGKTMGFYYLGLFYPVCSFLFEGGLALVLVYPFKLITDFLKKHVLLQFVISLLLLFGGCWFYDQALDVFMTLVAEGSLFNTDSISALVELRTFLIPICFLTDAFFQSVALDIVFYLFIAGGIFILGTAVTVFSYSYLRSVAIHNKAGKIKETLRATTPTMALIKKELFLLFKDSNNILSFTGLLIIQPLLVYLVISSLNFALSSGRFTYFFTQLPQLPVLVDILVVMMFTLIINQGANEYIRIEKGNVRVMKTIPVSPIRQLLIKVLVPFVLSVVSLIVTVLVLFFTQTIGIGMVVCTIPITILLLLTYTLVSLLEEMRATAHKPRSAFLSGIYAYLLPIAFFGAAFASWFVVESIWIGYLMGTVLLILLSAPPAVYFVRNLEDLFLDLEMVN